MNWIENHMLELVYLLDYFGQILPVILAVAIVFTFFLVQSFAKKLTRMAFYLDRIDNHLREITYFIKEHREDLFSAGGTPPVERRGGSARQKESSPVKTQDGRES